MTAPIEVLGWDADRPTWLQARTHGIGASDVPALLGFTPLYRTPWQVWAEKTGNLPIGWDDGNSDAAQMGTELEPYLIVSATRIIGIDVIRTPGQLYRHPEHPWRLCSPDAIVDYASPHITGAEGVQIKTAGLATGHGPPPGWDNDGIPLAYELQCRWEMHVMNWTAVELIALVANRGLQRRRIERDLTLEHDLVGQVSRWRNKHIVGGVEPPLGGSDTDLLAALYPRAAAGEVVELDSLEAWEAWHGYREAHQRETAAKEDKKAYGATLKRALGDAEFGHFYGRDAVAWSPVKGKVRWQDLLDDLCEQHGIPRPDVDAWRGDGGRRLTVKEID